MPDWGFPNFDGHLDPEPEDPYSEHPDVNLLKCRGCDACIGEYETVTEQDAKFFNGWWWCLDCYHKLEPVVEELERASKIDVARDDFIEQVKR